MNTPDAHALPDDVLFNIERRIAQRADELARTVGGDRERDVVYWRQAEDEIWKAEGMPSEAAAPCDLVAT